uniref:Uncharacterized protein n=1 Tax=Anguilla anguilla TaxID=7936 RepID=A0A0E9XJ99_ANGAN
MILFVLIRLTYRVQVKLRGRSLHLVLYFPLGFSTHLFLVLVIHFVVRRSG